MQPGLTPAGPMPARFAVSPVGRALSACLLLYMFLVGVSGLGGGFKDLGDELLGSFFAATTNPFLGLVVGLLATSLVQSSSVTTSLVVAMVAAPENPLPIANAVPMIMGANIGTTVTNTLVSLGHIGRQDEFRRAFAVATCHDFFNLLTVIVLLPVEMTTGYLQRSASWLAQWSDRVGGVEYDSPMTVIIKAGGKPVQAVAGLLDGSGQLKGAIEIAVFGVMIYLSLLLLVQVMRSMLRQKMEGAVAKSLDRNPVLAMAVGMIVTAVVQSSSITTSLLVPLGGAGLITLSQAFPITIGANIGTTVTALLASLAVTGVNAQAGATIALVHLLFNVSGTFIIYPWRRTREIPLRAARKLAEVGARKRWLALVYVVGLFYVLPMLLAVLSR